MPATTRGRLTATPRRTLTGALLVLFLVLPFLLAPGNRAKAVDPPQPNFVLIVTDDQRWDTLDEMPVVKNRLMQQGITFDNSFVVNPVCCPSRVSSLTGLYSHTTGVYGNQGENGGFEQFMDPKDDHTIATWLNGGGYQTAMMGRYLVGYIPFAEDYTPPGWDRWNALLGNYFNYRVTNPPGAPEQFGSTPDDYSTDVLADKAVDFIDSANDAEPLFLYFTPAAPHRDANPHPDYEGMYDGIPQWRPPSFNERDMSDKPHWLANRRKLSASEIQENDEFRENQYETLQSVDNAVDRILDELADEERLTDTVIVFTSDNAIHWGEHRWNSKTLPYNESIHVPMVVRYDQMTNPIQGTVNQNLALNIDIAPTFVELAGVVPDGPNEIEGKSLVPLISDAPDPHWRTDFLVENAASRQRTYCAVRRAARLYVRWGSGEEELYNLHRDPYEMSNLASSGKATNRIRNNRRRLKELCSPSPPGYEYGG